MMKTIKTIILLLSAMLLALATEAAAADRYVSMSGVNKNRYGTNDCSAWGRPCRTIQHAVSQSGYGDIVKIQYGEYYENITINKQVLNSSTIDLAFEGGWGPQFNTRDIDTYTTRINGMNQDGSLFNIVAESYVSLEVTISGFTLLNGSAQDAGGAIYVLSNSVSTATVTVENNTIEKNTAGYEGAAIYAENGSTCYPNYNALTLNLTDNIITENEVIYHSIYIDITGAISTKSYCGTTTLNLEKNVISRNRVASSYGGGIYIYTGINRGSTIANFTNDMITSNTSLVTSSGIYIETVLPLGTSHEGDVEVTLKNDTIAGYSQHEGLHTHYYGYAIGGTLNIDIVNSIIWGNLYRGLNIGPYYEVDASYSDIGDIRTSGSGTYNDNGGNIDADPLFVDPAGGDYHLQGASPAVDTGVCGEMVCEGFLCYWKRIAPYDDFEGDPRPGIPPLGIASGCDMGADEYIGPSHHFQEDIVIDFGSHGTYALYNGTAWSKLHNMSPEGMVVGNLDGGGTDEVVFDFGSYGIYGRYNDSTWSKLHALSPTVMATGDLDGGSDDLAAVFAGYGTFVYYNNSLWKKLHSLSPALIATGDLDGDGRDELIAAFGGYGLFVYYENAGWAKLHGLVPELMGAVNLDGDVSGQEDLIVDFGPTYGTYVYYNDSTWLKLHNLSPALMLTGDAGGVALGFDGYGLYLYEGVSGTWLRLHSLVPEAGALADVDGDAWKEVIADFGGFGIWAYDDLSGWSRLHTLTADDDAGICAAEMDGS